MGYGSSTTGSSTSKDRMLYMTSAGKLMFMAYPDRLTSMGTTGSYNDGKWHHVVLSMDYLNGATMYVDGEQVAQEQAVEQVLEPDAHREQVHHLLLGELDLLLTGHAVPDVGAVQGAHVRRQEVLVGVDRGVPVDVDDGRVGALDGATEEPVGDRIPGAFGQSRIGHVANVTPQPDSPQ